MLDQLIQFYLVHLESENKSPKTLSWYHTSIKKFTDWLAETDGPTDPAQWTPALIRMYFVALKHARNPRGGALSSTTINTYARGLRAFCGWLKREEFIDGDVFERVKVPSTPKLVMPTLSAEDFQRILKHAAESRNGLRDTAIFLFLMDTGCRASELCRVKLTDMNWQQRTALVHGKGDKQRVIMFSAITMKAVQKYILKGRKADGAPYVFQSEEGNGLTASGLLQICYRVGNKAGVETHPHMFRHSMALSYLRAGGPVLALQRTLGHTSLKMTERYLALVTDDLVKAHELASPVKFLTKKR